MSSRKWHARSLLILAVVFSFVFTGASLAVVGYDLLRQEALREAEKDARFILERNLAIHSYFAHQLKPRVFELAAKVAGPDYFEPAWMSSTYAIRGIDQHFHALTKSGYYYKECAVNARSPHNEADPYERSFIEELKTDPTLMERSAIRVLDGQTFFVYLRRGETMEPSCLRCHSEPTLAPGKMVAQYGPERGFHRQEGELVSAISIRIPMVQALATQKRFAIKLSVLLLAGLLITVAIMFAALSVLYQRPLDQMRRQARRLADDPSRLGLQIPPQSMQEWEELARDFNLMSANLKTSHDDLEERVRIRTAQLSAKTQELQESLDQVRQLSGLLPICSNCKKIRDDSGYWRRIEEYLSHHTQAQFSHGICPDCARKLYPDLMASLDETKPKG